MFCSSCGSKVNAEAKFCNACGAQVQPASGPVEPDNSQTDNSNQSQRSWTTYQSDAQTYPASYNALCIIGLVVSGVSIFVPIFGILAIAGIVMSILGMRQAKHRHQQGKIPAIIGIVLGAIGLVIGIIHLIALITTFSLFAGFPWDSYMN